MAVDKQEVNEQQKTPKNNEKVYRSVRTVSKSKKENNMQLKKTCQRNYSHQYNFYDYLLKYVKIKQRNCDTRHYFCKTISYINNKKPNNNDNNNMIY